MAKKATVDKWKTKRWLEIIAPAMFQEKVIGETFAFKPDQVVGRKLEQSMSDVTGDVNMKNQRIKLVFKIDSIRGEQAITSFLGHKIAQDYSRSLVRRRTSKIYANQEATTKDNKKVKVKSFVVTIKQINNSRKSALRSRIAKITIEEASKTSLNNFINDILYGRFSVKLKKDLAKIYPLRHAVVEKTEVMPTVQQEEVAPVEKKETEAASA